MLNTEDKNMKKVIFSIATLSLLWTAFAFVTRKEWEIKKEYSIQFSNNDVTGIFQKMEGHVTFDKNDLSKGKFDFTIETESVNTGNEGQNSHIRSGDFLDTKKYPLSKFTSTSFVKSDSGYIAEGIFELHGVQKQITVPFTFEEKNGITELEAKFSFDRTDYKVGNKGDGVDEKMLIEVKIPLSNQ